MLAKVKKRVNHRYLSLGGSMSKWVSFYGNAMSITENKPEAYSKNITLRYPLYCALDGNKIRLTFDNYCGYEDITISKVTILHNDSFKIVYFNNNESITIAAKELAVSDEVDLNVKSGDTITVSFYLKEATLMRSSVYAQGPLSKGQYAIGDQTLTKNFPLDVSRNTNIFYFLSNASIYTNDDSHAIICYGDSITAQDWPDYLALAIKENGINGVSVIRRATSGSRILREYSCITYESYGLKASNRFDHEIQETDGADIIIIQQGINDIIHPVGENINPFRPMSDLPTCQELTSGLDWIVKKANSYGLKTYLGTLLPINGWRTYAEFREDLKNEYNEWIRNNSNVEGIIDFDKTVRNTENITSFENICDSGDHLHPSAEGYKRMGLLAYQHLF